MQVGIRWRIGTATFAVLLTMCTEGVEDSGSISRSESTDSGSKEGKSEMDPLPECRAACAQWDSRETAQCPSTRGSDTDCSAAHTVRSGLCATLTRDECLVDELREHFDASAKTCEEGDEVRTRCVGDAIVADCADGSTRISRCSEKSCSASSPRLLGCRIGGDDHAFCECGCEDGQARCEGKSQRLCAGGAWVTVSCTQQSCDEDGLGLSLGCGERAGGGYGCLCSSCRPGTTRSCRCANGLSGTAMCDSAGQKYGECVCTPTEGAGCTANVCLSESKLGKCSASKLTGVDCQLVCTDAGFDGALRCGVDPQGKDVCLCRECADPCECSPYASGYACGANLSSKAAVNTLYNCANHATVGSVVCASGCHAGALGEPDYCEGTASDPCQNISVDDDVCGANLAVPLIGEALESLYTCQGGRTISSTLCPRGCNAQPWGTADSCKP